MNVYFSFALILVSSIALNVNGQDGTQLLMGTLVRQGAFKHDVLRGQKGVEEVQGKEVGKSSHEIVDTPNELLVGQSLGEFEEKPKQFEVLAAIKKEGGGAQPFIENKKGTVLDSNVQSGRYVPNPLKVIGEIKAADKEMPEILDGEILAGDPAEIDVLTLNN